MGLVRKEISTLKRIMGELDNLRLPTEEQRDTEEIMSKIRQKIVRLEKLGHEKVYL